MKSFTFLFFGLCFLTLNLSSCSSDEAHSRGYVISQSQIESEQSIKN